jgi:DNA polymerase III subunit delta'
MARAEPPEEGAGAGRSALADALPALQTALEDAPWLRGPLAQLRRARAAARFPAALLIQDQRGAGGAALAGFAVRLALCRSPQPPCGQCRDCRLLAAGQHPDYLSVAPLEDSRQIRVEQIRELSEQLALSAHGGGATVALIAPADAMNANAANALLKTLEEPRSGVSLLLLTALPSRLAPTILSRCQRLPVPAPSRAASLAWLRKQAGSGPWEAVLEVIGNAPFDALSLDVRAVANLGAETQAALADLAAGRLDVARTAEAWGRAESLELRLICLENWLTSRIDSAVRRAGQPRELRSGAHLSEAASDLNMARLLRVLDALHELRRLRLTAINRPLALELLLRQLAVGLRGGGEETTEALSGEHDQGPEFQIRHQ